MKLNKRKKGENEMKKTKKKDVEEVEKKEKVVKTVGAKKGKKMSLAAICTKVALASPKASYNTLCKKAEDEFKINGNLQFLVQTAMNDALDSLAVSVSK